jgi:hypothetical protein
VTFGNKDSLITTAAFSAPGAYVLMLTGSDGELSASATLAIDVTAGVVNQAPTANAGPDQTVIPGGRVAVRHVCRRWPARRRRGYGLDRGQRTRRGFDRAVAGIGHDRDLRFAGCVCAAADGQ